MATLTDTVKRMLNALAHAHAAEYLSPLQKTAHINKHLSQANPAPVAPSNDRETVASTRQQVALYMGSELPADVMNYVVQTCARLKHGLTVLTFQPESNAAEVLKPYGETLKSHAISMQLVVLGGEPVAGLARYLRRHPEVAFLACKETGYLGRSFLNGTQRKNALPVPVVLVESQASGTLQLGSDTPQRKAGSAA